MPPTEITDLPCRRCDAKPGEPCTGNARGYVHGERQGDYIRARTDEHGCYRPPEREQMDALPHVQDHDPKQTDLAFDGLGETGV